jgi:hypothetical protein
MEMNEIQERLEQVKEKLEKTREKFVFLSETSYTNRILAEGFLCKFAAALQKKFVSRRMVRRS